jgi:predicted NBD/HSP70 family sugar kinase
MINPKMVILGGGVTQVGDLLLVPIRQAVQKRSLSAATQGLQITTALLGRRSSGIGAGVQALSTALH